MNNEKISEFYKKLEQSGNISFTLKEKIQHIKNEDDLRKIIEEEIIPLSRKMGMNFTSDELIDYEIRAIQALGDVELGNISGGISNESLIFGGLASLVFLGFGHIMTGANTHAVTTEQATLLADRLLISSEYNPNEDKLSPSNKPMPNQQTKLMGTATGVVDMNRKSTPDKSKIATLVKNTEVNPEKNTVPVSFNDAAISSNERIVADQLQPTSTEGTETSAVVKQASLIDGINETHDVVTDNDEVQPGISLGQVLSATNDDVVATQTELDTVAVTFSKSIASVSLQKLTNEQKLYCIEALNPCYPFIYNITEITNNLRLFNGDTESTTMRQTDSDDSVMRKYTADKGKGSVNVMNFLFPSPSGDLNTVAGSDSVQYLEKFNPTPERVAQVLSTLYNYRIFRESGVPADNMNLEKGLNRDRMLSKLGFNQKNPKVDGGKRNAEIKAYMDFITEARYMIENQEKNGFSDDEEVRILPKYTTERLIISFFLKHFNKEEDIKNFYDEISRQLNDKNILKIKKRVVTEKELNEARKKLEETVQILKKYKRNEYSPYKEAAKENDRCQVIKVSTDGKISFSSKTFADCADTVARHVMNLLIYSQGKVDHPDDPWANILPRKGSKEEEILKEKLEKVKDAISVATNGNQKEVTFYSLKDRLQMFFLHQRDVGTDDNENKIITRSLWEYAICNLKETDGEIGPVKYCGEKIYELETGYKNMLALMCRCAKVLFPEKDVKAAYEKVLDCPDYENSEKLNLAIIAVFSLFNQYNPDFATDEKGIGISYSDLGGLEFKICQNKGHGYIEHNPVKLKELTSEETTIIKNSSNDFTKILINFISDKNIFLQEDFHQLFFGDGFYYDYDKEKFSLALSSDKVANSKFVSMYSILKFLKYAQGEEHNKYRINSLLREYRIFDSNLSLNLNIQFGKDKVDIVNFIFDRYINATDAFNFYSGNKKACDFVNDNNIVTINSFGDNLGWTSDNTNTQFRYTIGQKGNVILYPMEDKENLYVPSSITAAGGTFKVSGLGKFACYNSSKLEKVVVEEGITNFKIGECAFSDCTKLKSITFPSNNELKVLEIADYAFEKTMLESFIVPNSVSVLNLGEGIFYGSSKLTKFNLPLNVNFKTLNVGDYVFCNTALKSFVVPSSVSNLKIGYKAFSVNVGIKSNLKTFILPLNANFETLWISDSAFEGSAISSFIIPNSVSDLQIGYKAFRGCTKLTMFTLPLNVNFKTLWINDNAFEGSALKSFIVPKSVSDLQIGYKAFKDCGNLARFRLPSNINFKNLQISDNAFEGSALTSFIVPENVSSVEIGPDAFRNCICLITFTLPLNNDIKILKIGNRAFEKSALKSFIVPKSVSDLKIGFYAFRECINLTKCTLPSKSELKTISIGSEAFRRTALESFIVPDNVNVVEIGVGAFGECAKLKKFTLPLNPEFKKFELGDGAFEKSALKSFTVPGSVSVLRIGRKAFNECEKLGKFTLSSDSKFEVLVIDLEAFKNSHITSFIIPKNVKDLVLRSNSFGKKCVIQVPSKFFKTYNFLDLEYTIRYV